MRSLESLARPSRCAIHVDSCLAVVHVARKLAGGLEGLCELDVALDDKALVELDKIFNPAVDEQVVAEGYLTCVMMGAYKAEIEERGIEHDVAVVGDICAGCLDVKLFKANAFESGGRFHDEHIEKRHHYGTLEVVFCGDFEQFAHKLGIVDVGHDISHGVLKTGLFYKLPHLGFKLIVFKGCYIFIFFGYHLRLSIVCDGLKSIKSVETPVALAGTENRRFRNVATKLLLLKHNREIFKGEKTIPLGILT